MKALIIILAVISSSAYCMDETSDTGIITSSNNRAIYYGATSHGLKSTSLSRLPASINQKATNTYLFDSKTVKLFNFDLKFQTKSQFKSLDLPQLEADLNKLYNFRNDHFQILWHK